MSNFISGQNILSERDEQTSKSKIKHARYGYIPTSCIILPFSEVRHGYSTEKGAGSRDLIATTWCVLFVLLQDSGTPNRD